MALPFEGLTGIQIHLSPNQLVIKWWNRQKGAGTCRIWKQLIRQTGKKKIESNPLLHLDFLIFRVQALAGTLKSCYYQYFSQHNLLTLPISKKVAWGFSVSIVVKSPLAGTLIFVIVFIFLYFQGSGYSHRTSHGWRTVIRECISPGAGFQGWVYPLQTWPGKFLSFVIHFVWGEFLLKMMSIIYFC